MSQDAYFYLVPEGTDEEVWVFDGAPWWPSDEKKGPFVRLRTMAPPQVDALWDVLLQAKIAKKVRRSWEGIYTFIYGRLIHPGSREEGGVPPIWELNEKLVAAIARLEEADCAKLASDWAAQAVMRRRSETTLARLLVAFARLCREAKESGRTVFYSASNEF
jgi:hypothetical protein